MILLNVVAEIFDAMAANEFEVREELYRTLKFKSDAGCLVTHQYPS